MANLNKVMLIGNLTADPEVRPTQSGVPLTELRLAVNRVLSGRNDGERREETTFLDITCWNRTAEFAAQYLCKGRSVFVEGRLQQDTWEDKQTGQRRSRIRVVAENLQPLDRPQGNGQQGGGQGGGYQQRSNNYNNGGGYQQRNNYGNNGGGYQSAPQGGYGGASQQAPAPQQPAPQAPAPMPNEGEDDIPF